MPRDACCVPERGVANRSRVLLCDCWQQASFMAQARYGRTHSWGYQGDGGRDEATAEAREERVCIVKTKDTVLTAAYLCPDPTVVLSTAACTSYQLSHPVAPQVILLECTANVGLEVALPLLSESFGGRAPLCFRLNSGETGSSAISDMARQKGLGRQDQRWLVRMPRIISSICAARISNATATEQILVSAEAASIVPRHAQCAARKGRQRTEWGDGAWTNSRLKYA